MRTISLKSLYLPPKRRAHLAARHACAAFVQSDDVPVLEVPQWVQAQIEPLHVGSPNQRLCVIEHGVLTLALHRAGTTVLRDGVVLPAVDDQGATGFVAFLPDTVPYPSRASTARLALVEARMAQARSKRLKAHFGDAAGPNRASQRASAWTWVRLEDARAAGVSEWAVDTYLQRNGVARITQAMGGLPKILITMSTPVGATVIASAVMRGERKSVLERGIRDSVQTMAV